MSDKYLVDFESEGNIKIADDVIAKIAAVAANSVDGVIESTLSFKAGVADMFGVKNTTKGVKVSVGESEAIIDMYVTIEYGKNLVEICKIVQAKVKEAVENMTGLNVIEVNVHVSGISIVQKDKIQADKIN